MTEPYEQNEIAHGFGVLEHEDFDEYIDPSLSYEQVSSEPSGILIPASIWAVTILAAAVLVQLGQPVSGAMVVGAVAFIHGSINPRVAVYILLFALPVDWMIVAIPAISTTVKLIAMWVLVVSIPKLLRAVGAGRWDPVTKWVVLLLLWGGVGGYWAMYKFAWLISLQTIALIWGMALLICIHLKSRAALQIGLLFLILGCVLSNIVFIKAGDIYRVTEMAYERAELRTLVGAEIAAEANIAPRYFALAVFASIFLAITLKGVIKKVLFVFIIVFLSIGIILSKGRAVYVATPAALVGSVLLLRGGGVSRRALLIIILGVLIGVTVLVVGRFGIMGPGIQERFKSIFELGVRAGGRIFLWKGYIQAFLSSGGFGKGLNQVRWILGNKVAHNDWIEIMGDLGVIGLAAFFGIHLCLFRRILRLGHVWSKMLCLMIWCFIILAGMTQTDYYRKYYGLAVGLILAMVRINENESVMAGESS